MTADKMVTMLVCGGRDFVDRNKVLRTTLNRVVDEYGITHMVEGGATGSDALARDWARDLDFPCTTVPAPFKIQGRSAGPRRNKRMLDWFHPVVVVAFPGGAGTENCVSQAMGRGIAIIRVSQQQAE